MTASLSTMTIDYYLKTAAGDGPSKDMTSYYVSDRTPAGVWFGSGLAGLNMVAGDTVTREEALSVFRDHADPETGQLLGRPVMKQRQAPQNATTPSGRPAKETRAGVHGFDMTFSPPKSVSTLWALAQPQVQGEIHAAHQQAVQEALAWAEQNVIQSRAGHGGVAHVPVSGVTASLFDHWDSRNGDPQLHTHAVILNKVQRTSDHQWVTVDSQTLYRNMVAISEKYNSLLFDRLHQRIGAVAETRGGSAVMTHEALLAATESPSQGTVPTMETAGSHRVELAGVPEELIEEFSTRARLINEVALKKVAEHTERLGASPSNAMILKYRQQATLETRQAKDTDNAETLPEKMFRWRRRAISAGFNPDQVIRDAVGHPTSTIQPEMLTASVFDSLGSWTLSDASLRRTTFTRANVVASAERVTRLVRCGSAEERDRIVTAVVDDALGKAVGLTEDRFPRFGAATVTDPTMLNRGASVFDHRRTNGVYTTTQVMDEESYLLSRFHSQDAAFLPDTDEVDQVLEGWRTDNGHTLSDDQYRASREALSSQAGISAVIGPAGTGKTTTMSAITEAWQQSHGHGSVVGLAPSAVAAGVLGDEIGVATENTAKWLHESVGAGAGHRAERNLRSTRRLTELLAEDQAASTPSSWRRRKIGELQAQLATDHTAQAKYQFRKNQLVIIDEASMIATPELAELASQADRAGAKVLLVGDPAQLESVDAGGFLGHLDRNTDLSRLDQVWRFTNDWEKLASLRMREGDDTVLALYDEHGRIHSDPDTGATEQAYAAWKHDHQQGLSSLLIASDTGTVVELNERAHADRVASGDVNIDHTVLLREDAQAGIGETLLARKNNRWLRDSDGVFVANGTRLTVTGVRPDGSCEATVETSGATLTLDKEYLAASVELGYAVTAHRAQGVTVDTGHTVVSEELSREPFYVAMTRGKAANHAYVDTAASEEPVLTRWDGAGQGEVLMHEQQKPDNPLDTLSTVLGRSQAEKTAHEVQSAEAGWATDLGRMVHEHTYTLWAARTTRTQEWLHQHYSPDRAAQIFSDGDWQRLVSADPGLHHKGPVGTADTAATVLARCHRPTDAAHGPGHILPSIETANQTQATIATGLEGQIADQLSIRAAQARTERPDWYERLAADYLDGAVPQSDLDAVLLWRAASNQTDVGHPLGKPPAQNDSLSPLWARLNEHLRSSRSAPSADEDDHLVTPTLPTQPERAETPASWAAMADAWEALDINTTNDEGALDSAFQQWAATQHAPDARAIDAVPSR